MKVPQGPHNKNTIFLRDGLGWIVKATWKGLVIRQRHVMLVGGGMEGVLLCVLVQSRKGMWSLWDGGQTVINDSHLSHIICSCLLQPLHLLPTSTQHPTGPYPGSHLGGGHSDKCFVCEQWAWAYWRVVNDQNCLEDAFWGNWVRGAIDDGWTI